MELPRVEPAGCWWVHPAAGQRYRRGARTQRPEQYLHGGTGDDVAGHLVDESIGGGRGCAGYRQPRDRGACRGRERRRGRATEYLGHQPLTGGDEEVPGQRTGQPRGLPELGEQFGRGTGQVRAHAADEPAGDRTTDSGSHERGGGVAGSPQQDRGHVEVRPQPLVNLRTLPDRRLYRPVRAGGCRGDAGRCQHPARRPCRGHRRGDRSGPLGHL
jgi:hypothetical protein